MLVGLVKTVIFIFPFIKELFLGKDSNRPSPPASPMVRALKRIVIAIGCISVAANIYLANRLYNLATQYLAISREMEQLKGLEDNKKDGKASPQIVPTATQPKDPVPPSLPSEPKVPRVPTKMVGPSAAAAHQRNIAHLQRIDTIRD